MMDDPYTIPFAKDAKCDEPFWDVCPSCGGDPDFREISKGCLWVAECFKALRHEDYYPHHIAVFAKTIPELLEAWSELPRE